MYAFSTKLDTEKNAYDGFTRIISAAEVTRFIRFYPPNSRSILRLQKNGANAETCADDFVERRAVIRAYRCADAYADICAEHRAE